MKYIIILLALLLVGCKATSPASYQVDASPEGRTEYNGLDGMAQYLKDQETIYQNKQKQACQDAQLELAVAKEQKKDISALERAVNKACN